MVVVWCVWGRWGWLKSQEDDLHTLWQLQFNSSLVSFWLKVLFRVSVQLSCVHQQAQARSHFSRFSPPPILYSCFYSSSSLTGSPIRRRAGFWLPFLPVSLHACKTKTKRLHFHAFSGSAHSLNSKGKLFTLVFSFLRGRDGECIEKLHRKNNRLNYFESPLQHDSLAW